MINSSLNLRVSVVKTMILLPFLFLIFISTVGYSDGPANESAIVTVKYHGIRPTDPSGRAGIRNPERGLRTEVGIAPWAHSHIPSTIRSKNDDWWAQGPGKGEPLEGDDWWMKIASKYELLMADEWWTQKVKEYEPFGMTLIQAYCYLTEFPDKPIPEAKLKDLDNSFENLRNNGIKALLRFAYEPNSNAQTGPTCERVLQHLEQLKPIIHKNTDVIYVMQAGFIGAWGEWHSAVNFEDGTDYKRRAKLMNKILEVLPDSRMTQVRVPKYKRLTLNELAPEGPIEVTAKTAFTQIPTARIGFHNDGFLADETDGHTWPEEPYFANPGNPEFDTMTRQCPYLPIDGELFWHDYWRAVDGFEAAKRMRLHHYSSFSLTHSYSGREEKNYSIDRWMCTPISKKELEQAKMPIADGYFEDSYGNEVARTQFEYIRDHLGYRLEMQQATFPIKIDVAGEMAVDIKLVNRGFSVLHNPRPVYIVLVGADEKVLEFQVNDANPRTWQPFEPGDDSYKPLRHKINLNTKLPAGIKAGWYRLGLWFPDPYETIQKDPRYAVRLANRDTRWWTDKQGRYGINVLGVIEVK